MKPYKFQFGGARHASVGDDEITFSPSVKDMSLRKQRLPRDEILGVSVQEEARQTRRCEVAVFQRDGSVRRFPDVMRPAAEVESAFRLRGYPDGSGR
jgi:hypothetical protein